MKQDTSSPDAKAQIEKIRQFRKTFALISDEVSKIMVGYERILEHVLIAAFVGGNVLLEGVPGIGKTYLIKTLGEVLDLQFKRIQFTADLMPADIIGTNILIPEQGQAGKHTFRFQKGPVFTNLLLADEINRATPKTQSALLEAMEEHTITVSGKAHRLDEPFFVLATQNPIEQEGTYPLPKAQLDKFIFKLLVPFPDEPAMEEIIVRTTTEAYPPVSKVSHADIIEEMKGIVREVPVAGHVEEFAAGIIVNSWPEGAAAPGSVKEYVSHGSSPRGLQGLILAGKVKALLDGRFHVSFEDVRDVAVPVLRHRVLLNLEGQANAVRTEDLVGDIIKSTARELKSSMAATAG